MLNDAVASDAEGSVGGGLSEPLLPPPPQPSLEETSNGGIEPPNRSTNERAVSDSGATLPLLLAVFTSSISQFLLGYNTGVMNAPHAVVFPSHSTAAWSAAVAVFAVGGAVGAAVGGRLADDVGRRGATLVTAGLFVMGGTAQSLAPDMLSVGLSRFVVGIASGAASTVGPVYLREISPPSLSGAMGTVMQLSITLGILVADLLAFPWATADGWRRLFGFTAMLAGAQLVLSPFMAESPRWLLMRDRDSKEAREALAKIRGLQDDEEIENAAQEIMKEAAEDQESAEGSDHNEQDSPTEGNESGNVGICELFCDRSVRLPLVTALIVSTAQQLCGINAVFYYSTMFFDGIVSNPLVGTAAVATVNVLFTLVALSLMGRCGRKTLIMVSSSGMLVCCIVIVMSLRGIFPNVVALAAVNLYVAVFNLGLGPIPFLIVPELFGHKYVATAVSVSLFANWMCNFTVGLTFPFMHKYMGAYSFLPYAVVLMATFLFAWGWMPETGGSTGGKQNRGEEENLVEECDGSII